MSIIAFPYPVPTERRLRRIGRTVAVGALVCIVGAMLAVPLLWSSDDMLRHWIATQSPLGARPFTLNPGTRFAGALISLVGLAPVIYALMQLSMLFSCFARGEVFVTSNSWRIRRIGLALIVNALISPLVQMLTTINLTRANQPGQIVVMFGIEQSHVLSVLSGLALVAFATVMADAVRVWLENSEII
ncbi:DUF2975 domain-containing protein [Bradyrhizobium sp. GCM10027634]|uniref:DUF2975 domain-containing protein n=1 Tax=unclassified Bradyrhizobium TaxID=2631580 RepID=UPI001889F3E6|nr:MULTISPECIES: DUF2975 domain-containing protein [unclassified Bradyrhizobium]MDN5005768.1 DUF2975 domain-containing protein [Bradyrhizobium sp. WYCCWR 12677]QOZ44466.1 DUF2975 domain-containing protein [Bradyrhizobium sp. CCBAU 53340]